MKILSFDIGIKNLSFCLLDNDKKILDWGIINICCEEECQHINNKNNNKCCNSASFITENNILLCNNHSKQKKYSGKKGKLKKNNSIYNIGNKLVEELDKYNFLDCEHIIIENQPSLKNPTMKSIQMILYSYFLIKSNHLKLEMINARNKLKAYKGEQIPCDIKDKYKKNKYLAIEYCKKMIVDEDIKYIDLFNSSKKKDDLSDSYLQGIYYINTL
tara:strand:- start:9 stop:656 length:648 start_codon:yes stop_codon:yes gene_type:complete